MAKNMLPYTVLVVNDFMNKFSVFLDKFIHAERRRGVLVFYRAFASPLRNAKQK